VIFFSILFVVVALILIGIGLILGAASLVAVGVATALGIVSTSLAIGFFRKRLSSGFRALCYQVFVVIFAAAGIGVTVILSLVFELRLDPLAVVLLGGLSGAVVGLLFGLLGSWLIDLAAGVIGPALGRIARDRPELLQNGDSAEVSGKAGRDVH
jgi:hypothetical protein